MTALVDGKKKLQRLLRGSKDSAQSIINTWLAELERKMPSYDSETHTAGVGESNDDDVQMDDTETAALLDEYTKLASDLHAHTLWLYRSIGDSELTQETVSTMLASFMYLSIRHTWNNDYLSIPETEVT